MKTVLVLAMLMLLLVGCGSLPSMKYCDKVEYTRDGTKIKLTAECQAPVGGGVSLPGV